MSDSNNILPPRPNGGFSGKKFIAGSKRSQRRLETLGFDPIEKLVNLYRRLEEEDEWYCNLRMAGTVKQLDSDGNVKKTTRYSGVAHSTVHSNMARVGNDLMRYAYGRVPENVPGENKPLSAMRIKLTKSETVTINGSTQEIEDAEYEDIE